MLNDEQRRIESQKDCGIERLKMFTDEKTTNS